MDTTTQNQKADTAARQSTHPDAAAPAPLPPSAAPAVSTAPDTTSDTSPRTAPALEVHDVHKSFGTTRAVDGISLSIRPGEVVALLGRNGAGKTTLIDMVLGLQQPDSGTTALFRGGAWGYGSLDGLFPFNVNNAPSYSDTGFGFRLAKSL